jgi:CxxC-x17-CxxC domain-containing protein
MEFIDRLLKCSDCGTDFVFTAGEQLFFFDKQFKNDPKRCKLCKAKRSGASRAPVGAAPGSPAMLPLSRTETRTECSACGIETTVPFKPTQGRPVLCRQCFQLKRVPSAVAAVANMDSPTDQIAAATEALETAGFAASTPAAGSSASTVALIEQTTAGVLVEAATAQPELALAAAAPAEA